MKRFEVRMTMLVAVSVEVEADNAEQAEKQAMEKTAREEAYYLQHYDSIWEREVTEVNECSDEDDDPLTEYSEDYRKGIAYVKEQMEDFEKDIIRAKVNRNYAQHDAPSTGIDDHRIIDLLEEYGNDNDLPEGWYLDEYDADDVMLMI